VSEENSARDERRIEGSDEKEMDGGERGGGGWGGDGEGGRHLVTRICQEDGGLISLDQADLRIWIAHFFLTHEAWHGQLPALCVRDFCAGHLKRKLGTETTSDMDITKNGHCL
jgi:hypothetical protein